MNHSDNLIEPMSFFDNQAPEGVSHQSVSPDGGPQLIDPMVWEPDQSQQQRPSPRVTSLPELFDPANSDVREEMALEEAAQWHRERYPDRELENLLNQVDPEVIQLSEISQEMRIPRLPSPVHLDNLLSEPGDPMTLSPKTSRNVQPVIASGNASPSGKSVGLYTPQDSSEGLTPYRLAQDLLRREHIIIVRNIIYWYNGQIYKMLTKEELERLLVKWCRGAVEKVGNVKFINSIYNAIYFEPEICCEDVSLAQDVLAFEDGILNLESWTFTPHSPAIFVTSLLNVHYLHGSQTDCPVFRTFVRSVAQGDQDLELLIWQSLGYLLTQDQRAKCFFLLHGPHDSGKSVFGNFVRSCMDPAFVSPLDVHSFGKNFALSDLIGKRLCLDLDLSAGAIDDKAVSLLKKLTGGDPISVDIKYMPRAQLVNEAQFLFASNHAVLSRGADPAFMRRMILVPFSYTIPQEKQDKDLLLKFAQERDAIVHVALEHYRELRRNKYTFARRYDVRCMLTHSNQLYDCIYRFVAEQCEQEETGLWTSTESFYNEFTKVSGIQCEVNQFSRTFLETAGQIYPGVERGRKRINSESNPLWGYTGIALRQEVTP